MFILIVIWKKTRAEKTKEDAIIEKVGHLLRIKQIYTIQQIK